MPKGTEAQQRDWACQDCKFNHTEIVEREDGVTVSNFQCLHPDPKVRKAGSQAVLATCDSWEPIDD